MTDRERTQERILSDFYRYNRAERSRRKGGFGFNFDTDEGKRFADQVHMLKELEKMYEKPGQDDFSGELSEESFIPLSQEIHFPEELTNEQLLYYYFRKPFYFQNEIRAGEEFYGRLYLLELANELHHTNSRDALEAVFAFWDALLFSLQQEIEVSDSGPSDLNTDDVKVSGSISDRLEDCREYLRRLCLSFLIAHSDMAEEIRKGLIDRDLYWKYDLIGEIRQGRFARAGLFVKKYARLLKPEEIAGDKPYVASTWLAMPEVFKNLDKVFGDNMGHLFRRFLTAGEEISTEIEILPVQRRAFGQKRRIALADTCYLDSRPSYGSTHKERWVRTEWVLKEGTRDFLYVIHLYAESFVREYYQAPKRKRTADRFLKKKYLRTGDDKKVILAMKEVMRDRRFEQAIGEGVEAYMKAHPAPVKEGSVSRNQHARLLYQMDHEKPETAAAIDYDRFRQAKSDADSVLEMLHNEEIEYDRKRKYEDESPDEVSQAKPVALEEGPAEYEDTKASDDIFTDEEKIYLTYLINRKPELADEYLRNNSLSVALIMKDINAKALKIWDDVLLEREGESVRLVEDYMLPRNSRGFVETNPID